MSVVRFSEVRWAEKRRNGVGKLHDILLTWINAEKGVTVVLRNYTGIVKLWPRWNVIVID